MITDLPAEAKQERLQFKISEPPPPGIMREGCWGVDEVRLTTTLPRPKYFEDDMERFTNRRWLSRGLAQVSGCLHVVLELNTVSLIGKLQTNKIY